MSSIHFTRSVLSFSFAFVVAFHTASLAQVVNDVPDDEAKRLGIDPTFFTNYNYVVANYFRGMDAVSVGRGSTPAHLLPAWPDQLLDVRPKDERRRDETRELLDVVSTPNEILGRNTWMLWCGGNEAFWDWLANNSLGFMDLLKMLDSRKRPTRWRDAGLVNEPGMKQAVISGSDPYGLWLDVRDTSEASSGYVPPEGIYGRSSGIIGLRLFNNPKFTGPVTNKWDPKRYYEDPSYFGDPRLVRPYRVGMSCAFCHASAHPLNPPLDPANPRWENLSGAIGSQYLRIRGIFGNLLLTNNFVYHLLDSQPPGTIDTSLIASDNINNPNTMNAIFGVPQRVQRAYANPLEQLSGASTKMPVLDRSESQPYTNPRPVPRILFDGADSIGVWGALARVYLNIGTFHEQWIRLHEPLVGFLPPRAAKTPEDRKRTQMPFKVEDCQMHSVYWQATRLRVEPLRDYFLKITPTMPLLDARNSGDRSVLLNISSSAMRVNPGKLALGRQVFARNCIVCHSSIQPENNANDLFESDPSDLFHQKPEPAEVAEKIKKYEDQHRNIIQARKQRMAEWRAAGEFWDHDPGRWLRDEDYQKWALEVVEMPEFWQHNFLSTDFRVPVTYVGTNPGRGLASNGISGHVWEDFASDSYKKMPSVGAISFFNPYKGSKGEDDSFTPRHRVTDGTPLGGGGPGFYRPPSLISIWATAPLLHNNSLGLFNNDPSVKGRLAAFDDAIHKLLWPERRYDNTNWNYATSERLRRDHGLIWRTPCDTYLTIPGKHVPAFARRLPWPKALQALTDRLDALGPWRPVPSLLLFAIAFLLLANWGGKSRVGHLQRLAAFASIFLALVIGFLAYFVSGGFGDLRLGPIPAGTPVSLLANMNPDAAPEKLKAALGTTLEGLTEIETRHLEGQAKADVLRGKIAPALLEVSKCPDFVMDKGHYFPWFRDMTDQDKEALIELLKTF